MTIDQQANQLKSGAVKMHVDRQQNQIENALKAIQLSNTDNRTAQELGLKGRELAMHEAAQKTKQALSDKFSKMPGLSPIEQTLASADPQAFASVMHAKISAGATLSAAQISAMPKELVLFHEMDKAAKAAKVPMASTDLFNFITAIHGKTGLTQDQISAAILKSWGSNPVTAKAMTDDPKGYTAKANAMAAAVKTGIGNFSPDPVTPAAPGTPALSLSDLDGIDLGL